MKEINPIGRSMNLGFDDIQSRACTCSTGYPQAQQKARGSSSCHYCGCHCIGDTKNRTANNNQALNKNTK